MGRKHLVALAMSWLMVPAARAALPDGDAMWAHALSQRTASVVADITWTEVREEGPGRFAMRAIFDGTGRLRLAVQDMRDGSTTVEDWAANPGQTAALPLDDAPFWLRWLSGVPLPGARQRLGLDGARTSLAHDGPTILWVLGAGPRQPDLPQVQVERESGRLRRVVERRPGSGVAGVLDVFLEELHGPEHPASPWPHRIRVREGPADRLYQATRVRVGVPLDPDTFADWPSPPPSPPPAPPAPAPQAPAP